LREIRYGVDRWIGSQRVLASTCKLRPRGLEQDSNFGERFIGMRRGGQEI
jgi:hypothetical protein